MTTREKLTFERVQALIEVLHELGVLSGPLRERIENTTELGEARELVATVRSVPAVTVSSTTLANDGEDSVTVTVAHDVEGEDSVTLAVGGDRYQLDVSSGEATQTVTSTASAGTMITVFAESAAFGPGNIAEIEVVAA